MARIYANAEGKILRFLQTEREEDKHGAPAETTVTIIFDEGTNRDLVAGLNSNWYAFDCVGGVLRQERRPVVFNPPSNAFNQRLATRAVLAKLNNNEAIDQAEIAQVLRYLLGRVK
jgi:hypothetical protein